MGKSVAKNAPPASSAAELLEEQAGKPGEALEALERDEVDFSAEAAELGADQAEARWWLSKFPANGKAGPKEQCTSYGPRELSADVVREEWGPGRYYARLRTPAGQAMRHIIFTVAAPRGFAPPSSGAPQPIAATVMSEVGREFREALAPMLEMNRALLGAIATRPAGAGDAINPTQLLDLALRMAERMTPKAEHKDPIELLMQGMKLAQGQLGAKDFTDVLISGVEAVKPVMSALAHKLEGPSSPGAEAGAPAGNGAQPTKALEADPMLQLVNWLQRNVRFLLPKAIAKKSPSLYAELMLDNLPAGVTAERVLEALKRPGALDQLLAVLPSEDRVQAQTHKAWFEALQGELIGFLEEVIATAAAPVVAPASDAGEENSDTREA